MVINVKKFVTSAFVRKASVSKDARKDLKIAHIYVKNHVIIKLNAQLLLHAKLLLM